jgi:3-deoxy-D-manno-octulosonate 8-phosphate phosphatase KdsC-like HAD superfamily phosphatase
MTDGTLFLADDGQEYKGFNSLDGHGLKMLKGSGVELAIITGRTSRVVENRARISASRSSTRARTTSWSCTRRSAAS